MQPHLAAEPAPHELFGYEVLEMIGEGARSTIYVVAHPQTHQVLAMKHVVLRRDKDERFFDQLRNELEVSQRFTPPRACAARWSCATTTRCFAARRKWR